MNQDQVKRLLRSHSIKPKGRLVITTDKPLPGAHEAMNENRPVQIGGRDGQWLVVAIVSTPDGVWRTTAVQHDPSDFEWAEVTDPRALTEGADSQDDPPSPIASAVPPAMP
jgi:hypothetical protein